MSLSNPPKEPDEVNLCKGCNTMKHLDANGLCGRCQPDPKRTLDKENSYMGDIAPDQVDALDAIQGASAHAESLTASGKHVVNLDLLRRTLEGVTPLTYNGRTVWYCHDIYQVLEAVSDLDATGRVDTFNTANPPSEELEKQREAL